MEFRISDSFTESLTRLTVSEQWSPPDFLDRP